MRHQETNERIASACAPPPEVTWGSKDVAQIKQGRDTTIYGAYQWLRNGAIVSVRPAVSGITSHTLTIDPVEFADAGFYVCRIESGAPPTVIETSPVELRLMPAGVDPWWEIMR